MNMSAEKHKEQMAGEVSDAGSGDGSLSVVPSKKKLLIGGVVVVVGVVAYKIFFDRDKDDGGKSGEGGTELSGESLSERFRELDDNEVDVDDEGIEEEKSFEEAQREAADALHEDTPEFEGGD